jgi:hypothetical protein
MLLLLCGCSRGLHHDVVGIDPAFQPIYDNFGATYGMHVTIPIGFAHLASPMDAQCRIFEDGYRQIEVDANFWATATDSQKEQTVYHELGHCVFGRTHNRLFFPDGCPKSIMNPYTFGEPCLTQHFGEYIQELPYAEPGDYL